MPSTARHAVLFQRLRWQMLRNGTRFILSGSPIRLLTILLGSLLVCGSVFAISGLGFAFLDHQKVPFAGSVVALLFDFLFLSLAVMLIFSGGLILYSSLFNSAETSFLLSMPAPADQVFAYKFQGAVAFSSWAFLLLGGPVLLAYGLVFDVSWAYYVLLPLFILGFVLLAGSLGAILCLLVVNYLPRRRKQLAAVLALVVLVVATISVVRLVATIGVDVWDQALIREFVGQLGFAQGPLMPTHWMTRGLQAAAREDLAEAGYRLALVWSNGLALYLLTAAAASRLYRRGFDRLATGGTLRRRYGGGWVDGSVTALLFFLDPQTRLLIVKDFRTFRRDPAQWVQVLIFTGLMAFYFGNLRRFFQDDLEAAYRNGISLIHLASTTLLLCAYTSRFIYPLLSLEGRKFWVLGLLPLRRERLLWGKFAFALVGAVVFAEFLVMISDVSLEMPTEILALHALTTAVAAAGLCGLSVGLGAYLPNFRESDPSKIAVGFGGTLNLVASLLMLVLVVGLMAAPWHLSAVGTEYGDVSEVVPSVGVVAGIVAGLGCGLAAVVVPLRLGARTLREMEF